jgi:NAD(P)-dependent dehydrogenase (short-subunit alcohol dehydrogenase family)
MPDSNHAPVALVTGCSRAEGIGFEVCRQLAARGMTVLLTARDGAKAHALADTLRAERHAVHAHALDVADAGSVDALADTVRREHGRLDVLVNNAAGLAPWGETVAGADLEASRAVHEVTLLGAWRMCRAFLPLLQISAHPRIVNVSSGAGSHGDPVFGLTSGNSMGPSYATSKAALNAFTALLANELKDTPVLANAVCPGFTATFEGGAQMGARPVPEGAAGIVWAATLPDDGPRGGLFRDGQPLPW